MADPQDPLVRAWFKGFRWGVVVAGICLFLALLLAKLITPAHATDMRYCALWAREYVRVGVAVSPDPEVRTADTGYLQFLLSKAYSKCVLTEADAITLPDIPESTDEAWAAAVHDLMAQELGTEPATADPTPKLGETKVTFDPDWIKRCRADYRSFREEDGTVIRRGSKKRTLCPL